MMYSYSMYSMLLCQITVAEVGLAGESAITATILYK